MKNEPHRKMTSIKYKEILSKDILIVDDEVHNLKLLTQNLLHPPQWCPASIFEVNGWEIL